MASLHSRMSLRNLRLIAAIAAEGSLSRAAQSLNMTQSAVTKALQEVEAALGCPLFRRTNRGAIATEYGRALSAHAGVILTQLDHAAQEITDLRDGQSGTVVLGTLLAASVSLLPRAIAAVRRQRPNLAIRTLEGTNQSLMPLLRQGALDMVVGRLPVFRQRDGIVQEALCDDRAVVVVRAGHPLAGRVGLCLADLTGHDWILPPTETTLRRQIDEAFRQGGLQAPAAGVESLSVLITRALLREAEMLAVWPAGLAAQEAQAGAVAILPVALDPTARPIGISTRAGARLSPAAELVQQALREAAEAEGRAAKQRG